MNNAKTPSIWPSAHSATHAFLSDLLMGKQVTVIDSLMDYNMMAPNARASELRKLGWPIRSLKVPHPKLVGEVVVAYYMEGHFRAWWADRQHLEDAHPKDYPYQEGRMRFAEEQA